MNKNKLTQKLDRSHADVQKRTPAIVEQEKQVKTEWKLEKLKISELDSQNCENKKAYKIENNLKALKYLQLDCNNCENE